MDVSLNVVNSITLECLMNTKQFEKYKISKTKNMGNIDLNKDIHFYRRRIIHLTKELLNDNKNVLLKTERKITSNNLLVSFENFANECIRYFKEDDIVDILQDEYKDLNGNILSKTTPIISETNNTMQMENVQMSNTKIPTNTEDIDKKIFCKKENIRTIDECMKINRIKTKKKEDMPLPKNKVINLRSSELKNKGIKKKRNKNKKKDKDKN